MRGPDTQTPKLTVPHTWIGFNVAKSKKWRLDRTGKLGKVL
jgi:hypothetical protein